MDRREKILAYIEGYCESKHLIIGKYVFESTVQNQPTASQRQRPQRSGTDNERTATCDGADDSSGDDGLRNVNTSGYRGSFGEDL